MNVMSRKMKVTEDTTLVWAKVFSEDKGAPIWFQAIVTAWFFSTYIDFPGVTIARYLLVLALFGVIALKHTIVLPNLVRAWPLFVLPVFALSSILWTPYPSQALKQGVYFILTPLFIIAIISILDARRAMRCLMFSGWIAAFMVLQQYSTITNGGPYSHKNYVALQMNFMMLLSLAAALNRNELRWIRLAALPFVPMGVVFVVSAGSATNLVLGGVGIIGLLVLRVLWVDMARVNNARSLLFLGGIVVVLSVLTAALAMPGEDFVGDVLGALGKDGTLSGRTAIWSAGRVVQEQHPVFGTGLAGFWQPDNGAAQSINYHDYKAYGTVLTFHNAYMEVRVHLGYIGWALFIGTWIWQWQRAIRNWMVSHDLEASALLVLLLLVFTSSFTESTSWGVFNTPANIILLASTAAFSANRRKFEGYVPVKISETSVHQAR
ncbi:O-antigen ligase family protein [Hyphomonas sp.]|uniref:O-antigen ligase family protein n=1 Tax=Hyphomonas sp. TaxID=87 RepID=UPI003526DECB